MGGALALAFIPEPPPPAREAPSKKRPQPSSSSGPATIAYAKGAPPLTSSPSAAQAVASAPYGTSAPSAPPPVQGGLICDKGGPFPCGACANDSDCPPQQACTVNPSTQRFECTPGNCSSAEDCEPGFSCEAINTLVPSAPVRRCLPQGVLELGAACIPGSANPARSCTSDLVCVMGRCAPRCSPAAPASCGEGALCIETTRGAGCFRPCTPGTCPAGSECVQWGSLHQCLRAQGPRCEQQACAPSERCDAFSNGEDIAWRCLQPCNPAYGDRDCPEAHACGAVPGGDSRCFRRCEETTECGADEVCVSVTEDQRHSGCIPRAAVHIETQGP
jgi:hypothetical protein